MNSHKVFYENAGWQYLLTAVRYLLPLIVMPYLARVLEPEGYAVYAYVAAFMTFVQVLIDFGFNLSGTKSVARAKSLDELNRITGAITQARLLLCLIVGAGCLLLFLCLPIMRDNLLYSILAFCAICGRSLAPDFLFQGKEKMRPLTTRYLVSKGTSTILTFIVVHSFDDILWVPVLDILASSIALAWSFAAAKHMFGVRPVRVSFRSAVGELKRSAYYCLSDLASASLSGFTTLIIDIAITDTVQLSYWSIAITAIAAVQALYSPIANSLYAHMVANGDFGFAKRLILLSIPAVLVGTIAFYSLSDYIVMILGGKEYMDGAYAVRLVSPILAFSFYAIMLGWPVLGALGKVKELTATIFASAVFGILAMLCAWFFCGASLTAFCIARLLTEVVLFAFRAAAVGRATKLV